MKFSIIVSKKDIAGMNIRDSLLRHFVKTHSLYQNRIIYKLEYEHKILELYTISEDTIYFENQIEADFFIFATRHSSKSGAKTLSVHIPGNYGKANFGGKPNELCVAPASLLKQSFINLNKIGKDSGYRITLEATHHGPLIAKPAMFIEIGSQKEQWLDEKAGKIIADTIIKTIKEYEHKDYELAIGFGGTHYCPNFNKIELNTNIALSHICPKYNIDKINQEMIQKIIDYTYENVDYALLDWKGLAGDDKKKLLPILEEMKIPYFKTRDKKE